MTTDAPATHEPRPDPTEFASPTKNVSDIDYTPDPSQSISVTESRQKIVDAITRLYSGSASEEDMLVYAQKAVYDDPWSYCDTRYKIAGQWYGIPKIMSTSRTLATQIVSSTTSPEPSQIIFKLRQEYKPVLSPAAKPVNSLVTLRLQEDEQGVERVVYHKDLWNEKDYSHGGLGAVFKKLNGDYLTKVTKPPESL